MNPFIPWTGTKKPARAGWVTSLVPLDLSVFWKPLTRLELVTSPLPRECSTAELQGHVEGGPGWLNQRRQSQRTQSAPINRSGTDPNHTPKNLPAGGAPLGTLTIAAVDLDLGRLRCTCCC